MRRACEDSRVDSGWQSPMIHVEALLTENDLAEQFLAALRHRYLAEKFFYWFPLSVRAWLSLCQSAAPYKNFSRSYELIRKHAAEMARRFAASSGKVEVVGLGAGQGAFAPRASVGLEDGRDGELVFETKSDAQLDGLHLVSKHFRAARPLAITLAGEQVALSAGQRIEMSSSYKYSSSETFLGMVRETGGLEPLVEYRSDDRHFFMVLARP